MATNTIYCADETLLNGFKIGVQTASVTTVKEQATIIIDGETQHILVLIDVTDMNDGEFILTEAGLNPKLSNSVVG